MESSFYNSRIAMHPHKTTPEELANSLFLLLLLGELDLMEASDIAQFLPVAFVFQFEFLDLLLFNFSHPDESLDLNHRFYELKSPSRFEAPVDFLNLQSSIIISVLVNLS